MIGDKRGKSLIVVLIIIVLLIGLSFLVFKQGPKLVGMAGKVVLDFSDPIFSPGGYTGEVIDAGGNAIWNNISWTQDVCYQCEMPDKQEKDTGDYDNLLDMSGNILLLHLNKDTGDYSGNGNDFKNDGVEFAAGKFDSALDFDGKNFIEDDDAGDYLNSLTDFTVSVWVKSDDVGVSNDFLVGENLKGKNDAIEIGYSAGKTRGSKCVNCIKAGITVSGSLQQIESSSNIQTKDWQHIVLVWQSGQQLKLYVNGAEDIPTSNSKEKEGSISDVANLLIGGSWGAIEVIEIQKEKGGKEKEAPIPIEESNSWNGLADEVAIFKRALSSEEILNIYKRGVLDIDLSVRSCDDSLCDGEGFSQLSGDSPQNLGLTSQYFQYRFDLLSSDADYSPVISYVSVNYDLILEVNHAPVCSMIPDIAFNAGESYSINLADYFSDEDNDNLTYDYSAGNVSVNLAGNLAEITSPINLSGSVMFSAGDGENVTYCNVACVSVNVSLPGQNSTQNETQENNETNQTEQNQTQENNETNQTSAVSENPSTPASSASSGGGSGGGYGGGGSSATTNAVANLTEEAGIVTENLTASEVSQSNETERITPTITTNAINEETPVQKFASFFKQASLTTTQAVRNVGIKMFNIKGDSKTGNVLAVAIPVVLVIVIISFAWFIRRARIQRIPKVKAAKK